MENKDFKKMFGKIAMLNGFTFLYGGWFKESDESILVLELQKSNYSNYYYLNYKIFIQGAFGSNYVKEKKLVSNDMGDIYLRQPPEFQNAFQLDEFMNESERKKIIENLFKEFIVPLNELSLSRVGIQELVKQGKIKLMESVRKELEKMSI